MKLAIPLDEELHRRFKVETAKRGLQMATVVRQFIEQWLEENEEKPSSARELSKAKNEE